MIHINLLQEDTLTTITRMPVAEFGGRVGVTDGHLYEIALGENVTLVLDEQQVIELSEAILGALPPIDAELDDDDDDDDKGEEWKQGGLQPS